jgi:hypothetical protein
MKKLTLFSFITVLLFTQCSKDDTPAPTKTDYITKGSWKFERAIANGTDVSSQIPACFKDNTMTFATNGSGTISEGTTACVPPAPSDFTWSFQNNETLLNLSTPLVSGGSGIFSLINVNDVNLTLSQNMTIPPATVPILVVVSFNH